MGERQADREELKAALAARRELGEELEPELIDSFLERIEKRIEQRAAAGVEASEDQRGMSFVIALVSLGVGIPITGIAVGHGLAELVIVWAGIVLVNVAAALGGARRRR